MKRVKFIKNIILISACITVFVIVGYMSRDDVREINAANGNIRCSILVLGIPLCRRESKTEFGRIADRDDASSDWRACSIVQHRLWGVTNLSMVWGRREVEMRQSIKIWRENHISEKQMTYLARGLLDRWRGQTCKRSIDEP
jgi:hypothetical protein